MKAQTRVRNRQDLLYLLAEASELEHSLCCQYLFAAFTLKRQGEPGVTDEQAEVIAKWRSAMIDIAVQEMLHLGLASNLLTAIGGAPYFDKANFPQTRTYSSLGLDFRLAPASEKTLRRFVCFELPPELAESSAYRAWPVEGRDPVDWVESCDCLKRGHGVALESVAPPPLLPGHFEYETIGDAYKIIEEGFQSLYPGEPERLFIGPEEAQSVGMWKQLMAIRTREDAADAIDLILKQGEGAYGDDCEIKEAHFGRFVEVWTELVEGKGGSAPFRDVVDNPVFTLHHDIEMQVEHRDGHREIVKPTLITSEIGRLANEIFISAYEVSLQILLRYFATSGESEEQLYILKQAFLSLMRFCIAPLGEAITHLPAFEGDRDGRRAGPSFETFSNVSLLPQLDSAWRYFDERLTELSSACRILAASELSADYPQLRSALIGEENAPAAPGLASVFDQYATLIRTGLTPPEKWTWDDGIRAMFSPLDVLRMGTWIASEASVRQNIDKIVLRLTGTGGAVTMPPDYLLGDEDAPPRYQNPEGRWTEERIQRFMSWASESTEEEFQCPGNPTWHSTIRDMFTADDRRCMLIVRSFDLWKYEDVKSRAEAIHQQVRTGSMPPGQPWSKAQIDCFGTWVKNKCPEGDPVPVRYQWTKTSAHDASSRYDDIWFTDEDTGWAVNSNGEILHTTDGGDSWTTQFTTPIINNQAIYLRCVGFANNQRGWAGTISREQVLFHTTNGGQSWSTVINLPEDHPVKVCGMSVVNENVIYCSGTNEPEDHARVMKTTDGGQTWEVIDMAEHATLLVDCHFWDEQRGMVVGGLSRTGAEEPGRNDVKPVILYTEDGGKTWQDRAAANVDQYPLGEWGWKIHFVNEKLGFVSLENFTQGAIARTTDGGRSWVRITINDPQANANLEGVGFIDENVGWAGGWGNADLTGGYTSGTLDGGLTWTDANNVGTFINRFRFFGNPVTLGYASGLGVYKLVVNADVPAPGSDGAPKKEAPAGGTSSEASGAPKMLSTTTPKPFTGSVPIHVSIPEGTSHAWLHMWNQFGRPIAVLLNEENPSPGERTITWDGTNEDGQQQGGGVYMYRLTTDSGAESRVIRYSPS